MFTPEKVYLLEQLFNVLVIAKKNIEQLYIVLVLIRPLTADPLAARAAEDLGKGQQGQGVRSRSMAVKEERPRPGSKNRVQLLGFELFFKSVILKPQPAAYKVFLHYLVDYLFSDLPSPSTDQAPSVYALPILISFFSG
jgi:hypothetical protein